MKVPYSKSDIDRVHRIGKEYVDRNSKKKVQSLMSSLNHGSHGKGSIEIDQKILKKV